ncbi:50S ribosomal protein L22 [bacterium]|jgi:large subunit ribosomal protein L22|nr:50S ribosomal protein L22 [bacterium]NBX78743.1 50S ribosomal protein L22 [bacterium]
MQFKAIAKYVKRSPFKLRPIADVVRGKHAKYALDWLSLYPAKKAISIRKAIESAVANAKDRENISLNDLYVSEIKIDQGPTYKYFKPSAMGRSLVQKKRFSHISVIVKTK